jgi:hypothetical protein
MAAMPLPAATADRTNEAAVAYVPPAIVVEPPERSEVFLRRFLDEVAASDSIVFDRFTGPASRLAWSRKQNSFGYASLKSFNADGAAMFRTIGLDSLRTAALEVFPVDLWEDHWQGWFARFISGTIGNPEEEHIGITSISYSAVRTSWERVNQDAGIQWGLRPWRTNPYVYFLAHAGHFDGLPLLTFEGRAGYTLFGSSRIESRLTLQLPASFRIAAAASMDPARIRSHDSGASNVGVTLEHVLHTSGHNPNAVFYLGFRSGANTVLPDARQENMVVAGLSTPW